MRGRLLIVFVIFHLAYPHTLSIDRWRETERDTKAGLRLLLSNEQGVIIALDTPAYQLEARRFTSGLFQKLSVPGYSATTLAGEPQLPLMSAMIGVPADAQVTLHILEDEAISVKGNFNLLPAPHNLPAAEDFQLPVLAYEPKVEIYAGRDPYPLSPVRIAEDGWLRDQRIVRVEIYPFQYKPASGSLLWHRYLRVEVRFAGQGRGGTGEAERGGAEEGFEAVLRRSLLNYEVAKAWRDIPKSTIPHLQSDSVLYKITVDHDGLYRLSYADLQAAGVPLDDLDPRQLHLTSQGEDVAIYVFGEEDGKFDVEDYLAFYGRKFSGELLAQKYSAEDDYWMTYWRQLPDGSFTVWQPQFNAIMLEKYTDENVYWLSVEAFPGLRMATVDGAPHDTAPVPEFYTTTVHAEQSHEWYTYNFSSEDTWYWDRIQNTTQRTYPITLTAPASVEFTATLRAELAARTSSSTYNPDHHTLFYFNSQTEPIHDALWDGLSRYPLEVSLSQSDLLAGENQLKLSVVFDAYPAQVTDWIYFDWFEIEYARLFQAEDDQLTFAFDELGTTRQYQPDNFVSPAVEIYEITDPLKPVRVLNPRVGGGEAAFEGMHPGRATYFAIGVGAFQTPKKVSAFQPADFSPSADYIFITHHDFLTDTRTLANYRAAQGFSTLVVDVAELYDTFNYGIFHPIAIKNFLAYAFSTWETPPTYVLLVGDGNWNFKNYDSLFSPGLYTSPYPTFMPPNLAFVDPVQGEVETANLLAAVIGDDILPDVFIGRLPVNTTVELQAVIAKIIAYESAPPQDWQRRFLFIADNPDEAGDFIALAEGLIGDYFAPPWIADRIFSLQEYINSGECILYGYRCWLTNQEIMAALNSDSALIVNYIGHASNNRWAHESIFINSDIASLTNGDRLPVVLSMDCLDGYWVHPSVTALMEDMLRSADKGAVATFSPTGLGVATGHDALQRGFYEALLQDGMTRLGPLTLAGKIALFEANAYPDLIQTYTIFGDPALNLAAWHGVFVPLMVR